MTVIGKLIAAIAGGVAVVAMSAPASADHYWRHRPYYRYYDPPPRVVYVPPRRYIPPPVVYYPPPPPVVYRPAPVPRAGFGVWFSG